MVSVFKQQVSRRVRIDCRYSYSIFDFFLNWTYIKVCLEQFEIQASWYS